MSRRIPYRLSLEALEARDLPAVTYSPMTDTLNITGTNARDQYVIYMSNGPQGPELIVEEGLAPFILTHAYPVSTKPVVRINANLLGGDDILGCDSNVMVPTTIDGGSGHDIITGSSGTNTIRGQSGNDTIYGREAKDFLYGHSGIDTIYGRGGDDYIYGDIGNDSLYGDEGIDHIYGGNDSDDTIYGGTEDDFLYGNSGDDDIYGEEGNDTLEGNDGNDYLDGGANVDNLKGNRGRDTLYGGDDKDFLFGGEQNDILHGDGTGSPWQGADELDGGTGNDELYGDDGDDILRGGVGRDTLSGGDDNDLLLGGTENDTLHGDDGNDRLFGEAHTDSLFGDEGEDYLNGGSSMDLLDGGNQNDTLISLDASNTDQLFGRGGFDSFWIDRTGAMQDMVNDLTVEEQDTNYHRISSFANGADRTANGDNIADPLSTVEGVAFSYRNFTGRSLFGSDGPQVIDVSQGQVGDCWLLATMASAVNFDQNTARQMVADLGDNTYAVQIGTSFYRVDSQLPVRNDDSTTPAFAKLGDEDRVEDVMWVAMVEKAYALFRGGSYQDIHSDSPNEPLNMFGGTDDHRYHISDGSLALTNIQDNGWVGVLMTRYWFNRVSTLLPRHAYAILSVEMDDFNNPVSIELYNPHGRDNLPSFDENGDIILGDDGIPLMDGDDGLDDGIITVTLQQFIDDAADPIGVYTADFHRFLQ
ncbi:MAG: hypothetical protein JNJ77_15100 [Planctomycetia bacterium]|nr:hypothetical protein [Planctomycetia bacterium]